MDREEVISLLEEISVMLEIQGENPFKIRAYANAARALEQMEEGLDHHLREGTLREVKGIGDAIAEKIEIYVREGQLPFYEKLKAGFPSGLLELVEIPGLGGKKIHKLHKELGITSVADLEKAAREGRIAELAGFGKKSEEKLLEGIANRVAYGRRRLWAEVEPVVGRILGCLRDHPAVIRVEAAGSYRRRSETVGDLDFIVAAADPDPVMEAFVAMEGIREVTAKGRTKSSVRMEDGLQADLRVVPVDRFAFALHHFTGSKDHNVRMRQLAIEQGYRLSEWGLFEKDGEVGDPELEPVIAAREEADLFAKLGLEWIPPTHREGRGEVEWAAERAFGEVVRGEDLKGAFHNHTTASDGRNTLEEMAAAADALGWEYLGIADHGKASFQANGLNEERLGRQVEEIKVLNAAGAFRVHLFAGVECDILKDGAMDLDDGILKELDYVVGSIHGSFSLSEEEQTARLIRAIEHPATTMIGHLTGRILLRREGYRIHLKKVLEAAAANGVMIEINANPSRLDMDWRHWRMARDLGVMAVINPDAHRVEGLADVRFGVNAAQKGWLSAADVFNTRSLAEIREGGFRRR